MTDIKYRGYTITYDPPPISIRSCDYQFAHEDFDGPGDNRYGHAGSVQDAKEQIDEQIEDEEEQT